MLRKPRPLDRASAVRDAKLIVIATEDSKASVFYFEALKRAYLTTKVQVKVLPHENTNSSPDHVLSLLDEYSLNYQLVDEDELWLVIDVDRWGAEKLSDIARQCQQKSYYLAVSNPCIEIWFLLHLTDLSRYDETRLHALTLNTKVNKSRNALEQAIIEITGRYNKGQLNTEDFIPHVEQAIVRAQEITPMPPSRWPQELGTHVHFLVQKIVE